MDIHCTDIPKQFSVLERCSPMVFHHQSGVHQYSGSMCEIKNACSKDGKGRSRRRVRAQQMSPPAHVCLYNIKVIAN
jgi:hypothetical protein